MFKKTYNIYPWLKRPFEESPENYSGRRAVAAEVLLILLKYGISGSSYARRSLIKCFDLMWSASPIPFVSISEIENEIQLRFQHPPEYSIRFRSYPETREHFLKLAKIFETECSEVISSIVEPRSLHHLCKCTIRTSLLQVNNLPHGIKILPLPQSLQSYIDIDH
ncbi:SOCS box domain-containing protein [Nephila pilipes]|uniref:SOCS box domain-containing protein n=1 Tax=Nephila pilipes TaxID=299642 RepID=A0A8X6Q320_NEPPI|nr:SOCS box domain-containing protein [Nephila pilipes]